jgi:LacI family transcriptional regulator
MKSKNVTIKDVAKLSGYSSSLVSFVINDTPGVSIPDETRKKILAAVEELQYTPNSIARSMRTKKSMSIGIVSFWNLTQYVFIEVLNGVSNVACENNYTILFCDVNKKENEFSYIDLFKQKKIDGIIFISPYSLQEGFKEEVHIEKIKKENIPAVIINAYTQDNDTNCIYFDFFNTAYLATEYLINLGHKEIWYLEPLMMEYDMYQASERIKGFQSCIMNYGHKINESRIFGEEEFEELAESINDGKGPTAVVANKSLYAHKLLNFLNRSGIAVPEKISIIASNTEPFVGYLYPPLTSVKLPLKEMGESGAKMLLKQIAGEDDKIKIKLPNKIIERKSCKRL